MENEADALGVGKVFALAFHPTLLFLRMVNVLSIISRSEMEWVDWSFRVIVMDAIFSELGSLMPDGWLNEVAGIKRNKNHAMINFNLFIELF